MKIDPYNHKERYLKWKEKVKKSILQKPYKLFIYHLNMKKIRLISGCEAIPIF